MVGHDELYTMSIIHQAPGVYIGAAGGFEQGLIRIEAVAPGWYNSLVDGQGAQNIPQPPSIGVDDDLFVIIASSGILSQPSNPGDWTQVVTGLSNSVKIFRRKADATAADEFGITAHTNLMVAFMCRIRHQTDFTDTPALFQGGFLNTPNIGDDWDVGFPPGTSLALNTTNDPDAFAMLWEFRRRNNNGALTPTVDSTDPEGMETIASIGVNDSGDVGPAVDTMWVNFKFKYTNPGIAYSEFEQGYTPFPSSANHYTQHTRWAYFP